MKFKLVSNWISFLGSGTTASGETRDRSTVTGDSSNW